jgi:hypothetical protein
MGQGLARRQSTSWQFRRRIYHQNDRERVNSAEGLS